MRIGYRLGPLAAFLLLIAVATVWVYLILAAIVAALVVGAVRLVRLALVDRAIAKAQRR